MKTGADLHQSVDNNGHAQQLPTSFDGIGRVVVDPLRFKRQLSIGEEAYASLRVKKTLADIWKTAGAAKAGAGVAASQAVATTFFASTVSGGVLGILGLGTAAVTPVGWVVAAAVVSGGAYYGVTRMMSGVSDGFVATIPKFLNTPIDLLAMSLFDLVGALAVRVAAIDGQFDPTERKAIVDHFTFDWGLDPSYVDAALAVILEQVDALRVKDIARALAGFQANNPDCNPSAMQGELMRFLRDVIDADGRIDEREELALDAIARVLAEESALTLGKAGRAIGAWSRDVGDAVGDLANRLPSWRRP